MQPDHVVEHTRRQFLTSSASGLGAMALFNALAGDGLLSSAQGATASRDVNPLAIKAPHFAPKAKSCIFIFMAGRRATSTCSIPSRSSTSCNGQKLPESMVKNVRFAFLKKDTATLLGSKRKFKPYGECGMELSRSAAALGQRGRRSAAGPQHAHRPVQPPPGPTADAMRPGQLRPAQHGLVAHLRAGKRIARTCRATWCSPPAAARAAAPRCGKAASLPTSTPACCSATRANRC